MVMLKIYSIKKYHTYKVEKMAAKYVEVKCAKFENGCNWNVNVYLKKNYNMWMITKYDGDHTCVSSPIS